MFVSEQVGLELEVQRNQSPGFELQSHHPPRLKTEPVGADHGGPGTPLRNTRYT